MKKLPPFGRTVATSLKRNEWLNLFIFAGHEAWKRANHRIRYAGPASALVLPPGENPDDYRWPVYRQEVMLIWPEGTRNEISHLACVLTHAGAQLVNAPLKRDPEGGVFFKPNKARNAA